MSTRFYSMLWVLFAVAAAFLFMANVFTMVTLVVFGFISFGLVFVGMMCVLPGTVSHPAAAANVDESQATVGSAAKEKTYRHGGLVADFIR